MSCRVDTSPLIAGACVVGNTGLGVLGSDVPSTGTHGAGYIYNDLSLPGDAGKEVRGTIETPATGLTAFFAYEDSSFTASGPDGSYSFVYRLYVDGADMGTATCSFTIGALSLAAAQGTYTLTGQSATLRVARKFAAAQGSYALTGQATGIKVGRRLGAAQGAYALTGQSAGLRRGYRAAAAQGSYSLTGQAAGLRAARKLTSAQGSYALTGQAVALTYSAPGSYSLAAASGSYTLTGQDAALRTARKLAAAQGSYTLAGQATAARVARSLLAAYGAYSLIGQAIALTYSAAPEPDVPRDPFDWLKSLRIPASISDAQLRNMAYHHLRMSRLRSARRRR